MPIGLNSTYNWNPNQNLNLLLKPKIWCQFQEEREGRQWFKLDSKIWSKREKQICFWNPKEYRKRQNGKAVSNYTKPVVLPVGRLKSSDAWRAALILVSGVLPLIRRVSCPLLTPSKTLLSFLLLNPTPTILLR